MHQEERMPALHQQHIDCPYCGEAIEVPIDESEAGQQYIEDCQVCCRPILFQVAITMDGELSVSVHDENEAL